MPIPIIVLMCVVGLFAYAAIGAVVGALMCRIFEKERAFEKRAGYGYTRESKLRWITNESDSDDIDGAWIFTLSAIFWPLIPLLAITLGVCFGVLIGPLWLASKVGSYTAKAVMPADVVREEPKRLYEQTPSFTGAAIDEAMRAMRDRP